MELYIWPSLDERLGRPLPDTHENLAVRLAENPHVRGFKIHGSFRSNNLRSSVTALSRPRVRGQERTLVFVDGKMYGADSDVIERTEQICFAGATYATIAAVTGRHSMKAALSVAHGLTLIAVTVPTTQPEDETCAIHRVKSRSEAVRMLAEDAVLAGLKDIVCSGRDLPVLLGDQLFNETTFWIPGIRPAWADWIQNDDQIHTVTHLELLELSKGRKTNHILGRVLFHQSSPLSPLEAVNRYCDDCLSRS